MNRFIPIAGGVVIAAAAIAGVIAFTKSGQGNGHDGKTSGIASSAQYKVVSACDALTLDDAKSVLGEGVRAGAGNGKSDVGNGDIGVSTCSYSGAPTANVEDTKTVTLLARSAKSRAGADSNRAVFGHDRPVGKQDVSGVGDAAFWDAQLSQLDVLKGNNWYIIGNMSGTNADSGTLDVSRAVYEQIKTKL